MSTSCESPAAARRAASCPGRWRAALDRAFRRRRRGAYEAPVLSRVRACLRRLGWCGPRGDPPITTILSRNAPRATWPSSRSSADIRRTVPGGPRKSIHVVLVLSSVPRRVAMPSAAARAAAAAASPGDVGGREGERRPRSRSRRPRAPWSDRSRPGSRLDGCGRPGRRADRHSRSAPRSPRPPEDVRGAGAGPSGRRWHLPPTVKSLNGSTRRSCVARIASAARDRLRVLTGSKTTSSAITAGPSACSRSSMRA